MKLGYKLLYVLLGILANLNCQNKKVESDFIIKGAMNSKNAIDKKIRKVDEIWAFVEYKGAIKKEVFLNYAFRNKETELPLRDVSKITYRFSI